MRLYHFLFLDTKGAVARHHSVRLWTDASAKSLAQRMLAERNEYDGVEIWRFQNLVHREMRSKAA